MENVLYVRMRRKYLHDPPVFTLKIQYVDIPVVFAFDMENAEFKKFGLYTTGNFPPTRSDMPLFPKL